MMRVIVRMDGFPLDPLLLLKKVRLWQCVHLIVLAGHLTRDVPVNYEDKVLLVRLRTCISVAAAIASLPRYVCIVLLYTF